MRVDCAYQAFFRRAQAGETAGYPRFQGRNRYHSFTYPQVGEHGGARLDTGFLVVSKLGRLMVRWNRPVAGTPKTATISREADGWYVCSSWAEVPVPLLPETGQETGMDLGRESSATLADGTRIHHPRCSRRAERRRRTAQRKVVRRTKGSNRPRMAVKLLAKALQAMKRQRLDGHHTAALALVRANNTIC